MRQWFGKAIAVCLTAFFGRFELLRGLGSSSMVPRIDAEHVFDESTELLAWAAQGDLISDDEVRWIGSSSTDGEGAHREGRAGGIFSFIPDCGMIVGGSHPTLAREGFPC